MTFNALLVLLSLLAAVTKTEPEPRYDPATVVDLPADVIDVRDVAGEKGLSGMRLTAKTEADTTIDIYLGPASFVKEFEIAFRKGDRIHVTGSKVKVTGGSIILAREVTNGQATLYLRDHQGNPYWHSGN